MGTGTLSSLINGEKVLAGNTNQYINAIEEDIVPRNISGIAESESASLGSDSTRWLKSFIETGCWTVGDIKSHHSFNGLASIGQGWFPCNGDIINKTNYDLIFGEGSWDIYVISSALENKYSPDIRNSFIVGAASTTDTGITSIPKTGNSNSEIDLNHKHTVNAHLHQWIDIVSGSSSATLVDTGFVRDATTYNSGGSSINFTPSTDCYSNYTAPGTDYRLSTNISIKPESIEAIYYIRIV